MLTPLTSGCFREEEVERGGRCNGENWDHRRELGFGVDLSTYDLNDLG